MSSYKVPQDVEADDKLLGPFSFRQFIYLIVATVGVAAGWGLWMILPPLAVLPLPVVVFFGALALPLRKDQPMETYLAAILSFYLKPRRRLWSPDGMESLVEITAPREVDETRTKELSQEEAVRRLGYLANISDTRGWAVRGIMNVDNNSALSPDMLAEAQSAEDMLDVNSSVAQNLDHMIEQSDARRHQEMLQRMHTPVPSQAALQQQQPSPYVQAPIMTPAAPQPTPVPTLVYSDPYAVLPASDPQINYNPYPASMNQSVIQPLSAQSAPAVRPAAATPTPPPAVPQPALTVVAEEPSEKPPSPDIINLANNADLSIETIAREANRIREKEAKLGDEEVVISLR